MPLLRAQIMFPYDSGLPEDVAINTFHFVTTDATVATASVIAARLLAFYNTPSDPATGNRIAARMSPVINEAAIHVKVYNMGDLPPRQPIIDVLTPMTLGGPNALPSEVAIVLSYRASLISGAAPARRRGRIFIGPLEVSAGFQQSSDVRPTLSLRVAIAGAASVLVGQSDAVATWVVHSVVAASNATVVAGYVDDAFDTQRRRGTGATQRTAF